MDGDIELVILATWRNNGTVSERAANVVPRDIFEIPGIRADKRHSVGVRIRVPKSCSTSYTCHQPLSTACQSLHNHPCENRQ